MRTLTLARMGRALMIAAAMIMLPQLASAQLPVESKSFKIQASAGSNAVTLTAATVTASYSLNMPAVAGEVGSFLFYSTGGQLTWSSAAGGDNYTPRWDANAGGAGIGGIVWTSPTDANNPNWSRSGNEVGGILGTTAAGQAINFVTGGSGNIRMGITDAGVVNIATDATYGENVNIGDGTNTIKLDGTVDINGNTTIDGTTIGITGATTVTGATVIAGEVTINNNANNAVAINGGTSTGAVTIGGSSNTLNIASDTTIVTNGIEIGGGISLSDNLRMGTNPGADGNVLVSKGADATPEWQNLNQALGIRKAGKVTVTGSSVTVTAVTDLAATDAIIVTTEGTSGVVATVGSRVTGATGSFVVNFSAEYSGEMNFMVIKVY